MKRYHDILKRREDIIKKYDEAFKDLPMEVQQHYTETYKGSGHLYITRLFHWADEHNGQKGAAFNCDERNEFIRRLAVQGISTNVHYKPLPMHTAYKNLGFDIKNYPNAYEQFKNEVTLPLNTCMSDEDVDYVITETREILLQLA